MPYAAKTIRCNQPPSPRPHFRQRWGGLYDARWTAYSLAFRARNPLCVLCKEREIIRASECVDHIEPHKGDRVKFWDYSNHRALCLSCHNAKSAREKDR
jgi:5-methylcytosine-specific restriction endonuclease McrA